MTGYFKKITNPAIEGKGFQLAKVIEDFGNGTMLGEVDEKTLPAWQRVILSNQKRFSSLFPTIG